MPQHDRVSHTDSAPSMIALENFPFKGNKNKTDNFFQPIISKSNLLQKPLETFTSRSKKQSGTIDGLTFENDNEELARFIEDNYQYFKKQNSNLDLPADGENRTLAQLQQACSDSDFLTLKNNIECENGEPECKKTKNKKHKMSALSDSDFMVSAGHQPLSRKFTIKPRIPFAKTILHGKLQKPGKYNSLDPDEAPFCPDQNKENAKHYLQKGLNMNNNLSRSLNGCHRRNNETMSATRSIQRVLSEGNEASASGSECHSQQQAPTYDAFEMFIKLFNCEKNNKNICDKQSNKFNYKIVVNSKDYDYSDNVLVNVTCSSREKIKSLSDFSRTKSNGNGGGGCGGAAAGACATTTAPTLSKSTSDQIMLLNPRDDNFVYVLNSDLNMHNSHVLVNNFVITSPPLTPKMRSPKNVNKDALAVVDTAASGYLVHSQHLNDVVSLPMDVMTASPLDHLVNIKNDSELLLDLKLAPGGGVNGNIGDPANFIKNNLALTSSSNQGIVKRDKCGSNAGGRSRKPSVTYDINVINRSQDFNIEDMCSQPRNSYAFRSGSTSSTSRLNIFPFSFYS